jgi:hypothetical protein
VFGRQDLAVPTRVFLRNKTIRFGSGKAFSNNKVAQRLSNASCIIVRISGSWLVSITLFDPGLKTRWVLAAHKGPQLATAVLLPPSCDDVSVSSPSDRVPTGGALPEDVPPVGVGAFKVGL